MSGSMRSTSVSSSGIVRNLGRGRRGGPLGRQRLFHDLAVALLVEGRTAGGELPQGMVLLPHQEGAVGQGLTDLALIQLAALQGLAAELPVGERPAPQA